MAILHAVRDAIERHPSFAQKLGLQIVPPTNASADAATSTRSPLRPGDESPLSISGRQSSVERSRPRPRVTSVSYWTEPPTRAFWRHLFYVAIVVTLLFVGSQLVKLKRSDMEQRELTETALRRSFETALGPAVRSAPRPTTTLTHQHQYTLTFGRLADLPLRLSSPGAWQVRSALTAQGALIAVNIVLAFRGVQVAMPPYTHLHAHACMLPAHSLPRAMPACVRMMLPPCLLPACACSRPLPRGGVQIWSLIQRVKVVPWLQRLGWVVRPPPARLAPSTRRRSALLYHRPQTSNSLLP